MLIKFYLLCCTREILKSKFLTGLCFFPGLICSLGNADVIFLIYVYQRWVYPVDKKRVNEFGFGGEDESQAVTASSSDAISDAAVQNGETTAEGDKKTN